MRTHPFQPSLRALALWALLAASAPVLAADPAAPLPAWEQLSATQREQLIAPVRERWNAEPAQRARMLNHAQRWQQMTPEQRQRAHRGMKRWEHMNPEQRGQTRALFSKMRTLEPEQRLELKAKWRAMTPEQRKAWVQANPPPPSRRGDTPARPPRD